MKSLIKFSIFLSICASSFGQIATSSFFSSMRSINPGTLHLRENGFVSIEKSFTKIERKQDIKSGGILDGVHTNVDLEKLTAYRAGKGPGFTIEVLYDKEKGDRVESFETASYKRATSTNGNSSVLGGSVDIGLIGVTLAKASYDYFYRFSVGTPPSLNQEDHKTNLEYTLKKAGASMAIKGVSVGAFYSILSSDGQVESTLYNPTTGAKGSTEFSDLTYKTVSHGYGVGYKNKMLHVEASLETITDQERTQTNTYLIDLPVPARGSRKSLVGEMRFGKLSLGGRIRQIRGNFTDIEQLISSNLANLNISSIKTKLETSFNFSWGSQKGFSVSGFYTTSKVDSEEESDLVEDIKFPTTTKTTSFGVSASYSY